MIFTPYINAALKVLTTRITKKPCLWYINYFITHKCNLKCPYCYVVTNQNKQIQDPSLDEIKKIINDLYKLGTRFICLLGGEPFIRKDLDQIIKYIKNKKMLVSINSNGTLLEQHIPALKQLNKICISLEGSKKDHDKDRGQGTYDKILNNLHILKKEKIKNISVQTTVSTNTLDSFLHVIELAKKIGFSVLITEIACQKNVKSKEADLSEEQLKTLWKQVYNYKKLGYPIENTYEAISNVIKYSSYIKPHQVFNNNDIVHPDLEKLFKKNKCSFGRYNAFLNYDGNMYPCPSLIEEKKYNIKEKSLNDAYTQMLAEYSCKGCRGFLYYQTNLLFSSLNPNTLLKLAVLALKNYNY